MSNFSHRILRVLTCIPSQEWKSFRKHISCMYSKESDIVILSDELYKRRKHLLGSDLVKKLKENEFSKLSDKGFANLMSKLKLEFEDWMIAYDIQNSKYDKLLTLIQSYNSRGIYPEADRAAKKLATIIENNKKFDLEKTRASYLMKDLQYYSDNPIKYKEGPSALQDLVDDFNTYYKEMSYVYITELHNWGRIQNFDFNQLISLNIECIKSIDNTDQIELVKTLEKLMKSYDHDAFDKLSNQLFSGELEQDSLLLTLCCEYCIYAANQLYRTKALKDLDIYSRLYTYGLRSGALLKEGKLTRSRFYGMISVLSNVLDFDEMNNFIEKWACVVDAKYLNNIKEIAYAQNCFYHSKYQEILDHLRSLKYEDQVLRIRLLRFELVALYVAGYFDLLDSSLHNFNRVLNRNKKVMSKRIFGVNKNLIKVLNYLLKGDIFGVSYMLESNEPLIFRDWMEKKLRLKDEQVNAHPS